MLFQNLLSHLENIGAAAERDGRGVKKFCQTLAEHVEKYFSFCIKPTHADFDPVYIAAVFLDPFLSQMLQEDDEADALDFLKSEVFKQHLKCARASGSSSAGTSSSFSAGNSSSVSAGTSSVVAGTTASAAAATAYPSASLETASTATSATSGPGTNSAAKASKRAGTGADLEAEVGPTLPKRLELFKFLRMPEKQPGTPDRNSFDDNFRSDIEKVRRLYQPLRYTILYLMSLNLNISIFLV
jgi:hypothetical protein